MYAKAGIEDDTVVSPSNMGVGHALESGECNRFRDDCLASCNLQGLQVSCKRECDGMEIGDGTQRQMCKEKCDEETTCQQHCMVKTCCSGPEQCQAGGSCFRCENVADFECGLY